MPVRAEFARSRELRRARASSASDVRPHRYGPRPRAWRQRRSPPLFHVAFPASQPQWRQWFGIGLSEGRIGERAPNSEVAAAFAVGAGERLQVERSECALPLALLEDSDVFRPRVAARVAERATPTRLAPATFSDPVVARVRPDRAADATSAQRCHCPGFGSGLRILNRKRQTRGQRNRVAELFSAS